VPLVRTTANLLSTDPALRDVEIEVEGTAPPVSADPDMMRVVFQNLLINGAHAMQGKGRIRVVVEPTDGICQIAFVDAGPGIPANLRNKIFTPFFTTKTRGSGLGLPTVKRLVDAHQGEIAVHCPPSGGTTVAIRLPMALANPPIDAPATSTSWNARGAKISPRRGILRRARGATSGGATLPEVTSKYRCPNSRND
jgi:signal transduction histidine kinase